MIRFTLIELALVATPLVLFALYRTFVGAKKREAAQDGASTFDETPYQILLFGGAALALGTLMAFVLLSPDGTDRRDTIYIPPHIGEDGRIVPGRHVSPEIAEELERSETARPERSNPEDGGEPN